MRKKKREFLISDKRTKSFQKKSYPYRYIFKKMNWWNRKKAKKENMKELDLKYVVKVKIKSKGREISLALCDSSTKRKTRNYFSVESFLLLN